MISLDTYIEEIYLLCKHNIAILNSRKKILDCLHYTVIHQTYCLHSFVDNLTLEKIMFLVLLLKLKTCGIPLV